MHTPHKLLAIQVAMVLATVATFGQLTDGSTYIGGTAAEGTPRSAAMADGSVITVLTTSSPSLPTTPGAMGPARIGGRDVYVERRSSNGTLLAASYLGTTDDDAVADVTVAPDSTVIIVYATERKNPVATHTISLSPSTESAGMVVRLNAALTTSLNSTVLTSEKPFTVLDVVTTSTGSVMVAGRTEDEHLAVTARAPQPVALGDHDGFIVLVSADLSVIEFASYIATKEDDAVLRAAPARANGWMLTGTTSLDSGTVHSWVKWMDSTGAIVRTTTLRSSVAATVVHDACMISPVAAVVVGATLADSGTTDTNAFIIRVDTGGTAVERIVESTASDVAYCVQQMLDGRLVVGLRSNGSIPATADASQQGPEGNADVVALVLPADVASVDHVGYVGGSGHDVPSWMSVDSAYVFTSVVWTTSGDLRMPSSAARRSPPVSDLPDAAFLRWKLHDTISVSPLIINMDTVMLGASANQSFHVRNIGRVAPVNVSMISTFSSSSGLVSRPLGTVNLPAVIDSACILEWKPQQPGPLREVLQVIHNTDTIRVQIVGMCIDSTKPPPPPKPTRLLLSDVSCGKIRLGDTSMAFMPLRPDGSDTVAVDSVTIAPANAGMHLIGYPQRVYLSTAYLTVSCSPSRLGPDSARVRVWYADTTVTAMVRWVGEDSTSTTGANVDILQPKPVELFLDTPTTIVIPIRNTGGKSTDVIVAIQDPDPVPSWDMGQPSKTLVRALSAGRSDTIRHTVTAGELGLHDVIYSVTFDGTTVRRRHTLRSSLPQPGIRCTAVGPDTVDIGRDSITHVTIVNPSAMAVRVDSVVISHPDFTLQTPPGPFRLAPSEERQLDVRFRPVDTTEVRAVVQLWTSTQRNGAVTLRGVGRRTKPVDTTHANMELRCTVQDSATVGEEMFLDIVVRSTGSKALHVVSADLGGSDPAVTFAASVGEMVIPPAGSRVVQLRIIPTTDTALTCRCTVYADGLDRSISVRVPVRHSPDTTGPSTSAPHITMQVSARDTTVDIGATIDVQLRLTTGAAWLRAAKVNLVTASISYRNSVITVDASSASDVVQGHTRQTLLTGEIGVDSVLLTTTLTACFGDSTASDVSVSNITFIADSGVVVVSDTLMLFHVQISDAWSAYGPRIVRSDTTKPAVTTYPSPSTGSVTAEVFHVDAGGTLEVFDNTGNLMHSWTISPSAPATVVSIPIGNELASGTYLCVVRTGGSVTQRRFVISR